MSNCRRLLCRQLSSAYLNYLPFYFLIYRPFSLYLSSCEYWQSLPSLNTYGPIHQRTKARSLTHHCIPKRWNIHFFFSGLLHKTISRVFSWIGNTRQVAPTKHTPKYLLNTI
ncbi:BCN_G0045020.mRNA.1.CDS.1 [Saccharomyces cerevisiae]|nr:BCN_G0045020.mRNA.1.CDS.1 [Saccharomyces cerevisiae]CAI7298706.1 BCN_G0045020.mRNA.1.CDS.1 [Saccharomyces cerevisiae]